MKLFYLLRHAKSNWDDPSIDDFDRPLSKRGQKTARLLADYFGATGIRPASILCSPARRARETLDLISPAIGEAGVTFDQRLYEASRQTLVALLTELPAEIPTALLIGHNPGLERLALFLTNDTGPDPALARMRMKFPTGGLAVLSAPIVDWSRLKGGSCRLDAFIRPADLEAPA